MTHTLITGAESGLGLALIRVFIAAGSTVTALCRKTSPALDALSPDIHQGVDVTDAFAVGAAAAQIGDKTIDVLINNAGIMIEDNIDSIDIDDIRAQFEVNALGPLSVALAFRRHFRRGSKVVNISSRLGSMADNGSGDDYGYRISKAAQNMLTSNLSIDLARENVIVAGLHPGIVATSMNGGKGSPADEVAGDLKAVIDKLDASRNGRFIDRFGNEIPW